MDIKVSKVDKRELRHPSPTLKSMKTLYKRVNSIGNEHFELNKEEIEKLKNLLGTLKSPSGACSLTQSDESLLLLLVSQICLS